MDNKYLTKKHTDFDSKEEWHFYLWTIEALKHKIIEDATYHPWKATLGNSVSIKVPRPTKRKPDGTRKIHLLRAIQYEPDWIIQITGFRNYFVDKNYLPIRTDVRKRRQYEPHYRGTVLVVDVKGTFARLHNDQIKFSLVQKWMFHQYGVYINKVVPKKFFRQMWVPKLAAFTEKTHKRAKQYEKCIFVEEWLENKESENATEDINTDITGRVDNEASK